MKRIKIRLLKFFAVFTALSFLNEIAFPTIALALTSGPKSPEFTSFTPVATTNMVDLATGDFNYNLPVLEIPGTDGGGYALSLAYNSGINSEQEASWVGFGWNINPGAINRSLRGFPDDYNGQIVKIYNKSRPNWSITTGKNFGLETFTVEFGVEKSLRFNNHYGFLSSTDLSIGVCGLGLGIHLDPDEPRPIYSANVNPYKIISAKKEIARDIEQIKSAKSSENRDSKSLGKLKVRYDYNSITPKTSVNMAGSNYGIFTYSDAMRNTTYTNFKGINVNFTTGMNFNLAIVPVGGNVGQRGNINLQTGYFETDAKAYGYFNYNDSENIIQDYYVEKSSDINKRDVFIGMPFSNADVYGVTGEGMNGGFRGYNDRINNYKYATPGGNSSKITIFNVGIDISVGLNFGAGMSLGAGRQENTMKSWSRISSVPASPVFRFNHDLGGKIIYGNNNNIEKADLMYESEFPGMKSVAVGDASLGKTMNKSEAGSASFIDHHTYQQINNIAANSFTKKINFVTGNNPEFPVGGATIMEYSITNENGDNYVYGVPVFTRNETNLSFDIDLTNSNHSKINNYLAFRAIPLSTTDPQSSTEPNKGKYEVKTSALKDNSNKAVLGEIRNSPYVSTYLLSQITQPNYVDVNNNGPDDADFGGWTKFNYRKKYGSFSDGSENWYRYRTPYIGLHYSQNSISDPKDDLGSVTTGEKEVYYLETIETKTHIAFFVTNKYRHNDERYNVGNGSAISDVSKSRKDGMGATRLSDTEDPAAKSTTVSEDLKENELEYLEKIVLFSKAQPDKPIKTVYFGYDYSLVPNVPNNIDANFDYKNSSRFDKEGIGKLTLRKVWFEYEGTSPARISPYEFSYTYKKSSAVKTGRQYFLEFDDLSSAPGSAQNPAYAPEQLDPWGNIMPYGKERQEYNIPWRYQGNNSEFRKEEPNSWRKKAVNDEEFDPAAWHLKSIRLPSGGEIHIQYEEKNYCYVQDEPVMSMCSLIESNNDYVNPWFDINVDDLGCDPGDINEVSALKERIESMFARTSVAEPGSYADKIYFKFLFDLAAGNSNSNVNLQNPDAEYITGYAEFKEATIEQYDNKYAIRIHLSGGDQERTPRQAAYEFFVNQRQGILEKGKNFGPLNYNKTFDGTFTEIAKESLYDDIQLGDIIPVIFKMFPLMADINDLVQLNARKTDVCGSMSNSLSYLKLPLFNAKKGGGVRVKRLLLYDPGFEAGDARVTGVNYHYVLEDGVSSSGVATNEPPSAREENPLVKYMVRKGQSNFSRLTSGTDREQTEGPLGESLLPMAAVYHSRVVAENIHSDKVKTGFTVNEFYTTKDYPFNGNYAKKMYKNESGGIGSSDPDLTGKGVEFTSLSEDSKEDYVPPLPTPFFSYSVNKVWMAQGFRFIQNSMNGLLKGISVYGGSYLSEPGVNKKDIDRGYLVSMTQNEYFEPGELIPMIKPLPDGGFEIYHDTPGKEMEIAIEGKKLSEDVFTLDVSFDATVGIAGVIPILFISVVPNIGINQDLVATHATTKVIRYPAILKSVTTFLDGVVNRTEYQAFNAYTGQPVIVKTYDGYSDLGLIQPNGTKTGEIYRFTMPANWKYPEMGPKSASLSNTNQLSSQTLNIVSYGKPPSSSWFDGSGGAIANVLGININTYQKNWESSWSDPKIKNDYNISEAVKSKLNSIWRPKAEYIYKTDETVDPADKPVYDKGFFTVANMFDWNSPISQPNWIKVSEITKYSPYGNPLEEIDVMNIPSAVLYGSQYGSILPVMIAQNANYNDIYFNDFENMQNSSSMAHSGKYSMPYSSQLKIIDGVYVTKHLKQKGGVIKLWMAFENAGDIPAGISLIVGASPVPLKKSVTNGSWSLYECTIAGNLFPEEGSKADILIDGYAGSGNAYVDDVRFQPLDAQAACYVYDLKSFRLMTQFDDQHFGMFYKYNQEGALTHKIIETERGLKTVQETHYNIPKVSR